jgi:hypothetical protein
MRRRGSGRRRRLSTERRLPVLELERLFHSICKRDKNVPGLDAKPIIDIQVSDIQVSVQRLRAIRRYAEPLATLGYLHVPHADYATCPFFHRPREWPHTHHVHVVQSSGQQDRRTLAFRDFLREHSDIATEYVALKKRLAALTDAADMSSRVTHAQKASLSSESSGLRWPRGIRAIFDRHWREIASDNVVIALGKILEPTPRLCSI